MSQPEQRELHRRLGVELNNGTWDLLERVTPDSPQADRERVLYGAYASCYHWLQAGTPANHGRGEHLIASAALAAGLPEVALGHARRYAELIDAHPDVMEDWDHAFAAEALARALAGTGDLAAAQVELARAEELTAKVADPEDRQVLLDRLAHPPWYGLRD